MSERIVLFRALQLGDLLCAVPAMRAIRHARPAAHITLIGLPWAADFATRLPYINDFMEFPGFPGLPERRPDLASLEIFLAEAQSRRFDLAIQMHGSGILTNQLISLLGARRCAGFYLPDQPCPNPQTFLPWPDELPEIRRLLALTEHLGMPSRGEALELPILPAEAATFAALRAMLPIGERGYACIHPGARLASRRWLPERFALVADALAAVGLGIVLTGTADEAPLLAAIRQNMRQPAIDLAGHTTLGTLAALVAAADLVVCNDTGMSHVAAAVGTPSVVICSGADDRRWRPLDGERHRVLAHPVPCRPCAYDECPTGHACARGVSVEDVVRESFYLLSNQRRSHHVAE
ncbi:glycosyltransferase family 9 protein [Dechloromonas sp. XY25]|uniref:Glycosyltransferase family 9 protein n=1 Tax=Dechloromonas hankyongensis TaxID=2908002 RepID=A0ABS9K6M8_9RHOO|nr:glycosyltransferase family 9 protein [Dechloromonas hankyongensis]MCG2578739.1 glycosyltransferase family 9 protein [Dechloromonas hankyongensis]